ncbi:MAG TPA: serpin family protein [Chryseolinea sp.]|nr:serpin family protein [Chryseolinea sp.]HPH46389.1 serpin family protein [Chryseolinea sp.]HPM31029.1 serpin family protein [Chryseolinea sp.]
MKYIILLFISPFILKAQDYKPVVEANNSFGLDLCYGISSTSDHLLSPISISSAIAMTYVGALGETKDQMKKVFYYPEDLKLNAGFSDISKILSQPFKSSSVSIANKLWVGDGRVNLNPDFVSINQQYYSAALETLNFDDPNESSKTINNWVSSNTNNKINELIDPSSIGSDVILILTNAVYFKSNWKKKFDPSLTTAGKFATDKDEKIDVSYMFNKGSFNHYEDDIVRVIELPYEGDDFSFLLLLPRTTMDILEDRLTNENYSSWILNMRPREFDEVRFPKFRNSFRIELSKVLKDMGMTNAFNGSAQFEGIGNSPRGKMTLSKVIHQSFIEVNEEGTEAAAATGVVVVARSAPGRFIVDRPFIYAIRHVKTNTLLFIGKASNPKY